MIDLLVWARMYLASVEQAWANEEACFGFAYMLQALARSPLL